MSAEAKLKALLGLQRQSKATPWKRWPAAVPSSEQSAESLVAHSLLQAKPSPFTLPGHIADEISWDEEGQDSHWLVDDASVFYKIHRLPPSAEAPGRKQFFDLQIVMPVNVLEQGGHIRIVNPDGDNYYHFAETAPGAHLLFGHDKSSSQTTAIPATEKESDGNTGGDTTADEADQPLVSAAPASREPNAPEFPTLETTESTLPGVCDVWASFLNVHLGTIRNCTLDQISEIARLFKETFGSDAYVFDTPIQATAKGVYAAPTSNNNKKGSRRLVTNAQLASEIDLGRFRLLRRRLKYFLLTLHDRFSVLSDGSPKFDLALSENCR